MYSQHESILVTCSSSLYPGTIAGKRSEPMSFRSVSEVCSTKRVSNRGLSPQQDCSEAYRPVIYGTGVSIKITTNNEIGEEIDEQKLMVEFGNSPIMQLEYSYVPWNSLVDLFYDISAVDDSPARQFCQDGCQLRTTSIKGDSVFCPAQCDKFCPHVYNRPDDNWATRGCSSHVALELALCTSYIGTP